MIFRDFGWVTSFQIESKLINTSLTFQQEKFPDSDLSAAWIEDVKLSLTRHREKIVELTKELEQETLYVEYLERLLGEVERYRDSGSNPSQLVDAATPTITLSNNRISVNEKNGPADNKDTDEVRRISWRLQVIRRKKRHRRIMQISIKFN